MNSKNSGTSDYHRLLLNISDKIDLNGSDIYVALSNLSIYYTRKNKKMSYTKINLKYLLRDRMKSLNYLMDRILYQIFKNILNIYLKKHGGKTGEKTDNSSIMIHIYIYIYK